MSDREILFRGKHVDNGEWVEGFLSKSRGMNRQLQYCIDHEEQGVMLSSIIDFETLGQYTGLTDKNGTKIFEGDIVKGKSLLHGYDDIFIVVWDNGGFFFKPIRNADCLYCYENMSDIEVIGNIHDDPNLLEGEQNGN